MNVCDPRRAELSGGPQVPGGGVQTVRAERSRKGVTLDGAAEKTLGKTRSLNSR